MQRLRTASAWSQKAFLMHLLHRLDRFHGNLPGAHQPVVLYYTGPVIKRNMIGYDKLGIYIEIYVVACEDSSINLDLRNRVVTKMVLRADTENCILKKRRVAQRLDLYGLTERVRFWIFQMIKNDKGNDRRWIVQAKYC